MLDACLQARSRIHFQHSCYGYTNFQIICTDELKQVRVIGTFDCAVIQALFLWRILGKEKDDSASCGTVVSLLLVPERAGATGKKLFVPRLCYIGVQPDHLLKHRGTGQDNYVGLQMLSTLWKAIVRWDYLSRNGFAQEHMETWMFEYVQVIQNYSFYWADVLKLPNQVEDANQLDKCLLHSQNFKFFYCIDTGLRKGSL